MSKGLGSAPDILVTAATWQPTATVARWIESGANVNASNPAQYARTPLLTAVTSEAEGAETLKLLLDRGADPNARTTEGESALDWAIYKGDRAKIELLEGRGAKRGNGPRQEDIAPPATGGISDPRVSLTRSLATNHRRRPTVPRAGHLHFVPSQCHAGDWPPRRRDGRVSRSTRHGRARTSTTS